MAQMNIIRQPIYVQVKEAMLHKLSSREWSIGKVIPSESKLAGEFGVSIGTIRKAVDELVEQDLLVRRHGSGTFVKSYRDSSYWNRFQKFQSKDGHLIVWESRLRKVERIGAPETVAQMLGIARGDTVFHVVRELYSPIYRGIDEVFLPYHRFQTLKEEDFAEIHGNLYRFYEEKFGVYVAEVFDSLECKVVDQNLHNETNLPIGSPLFFVTRIGRGFNKDPLEVRFEKCLAIDLRILI